MIKLCVGASSVEDLQTWAAERLAEAARNGEPPEQSHTTRMIPKRSAEILSGGSLYWVIKGVIAVRQPIRALSPVVDPEGIRRCRIVLEPRFTRTHPQPRRAFQGWRYLDSASVPVDLVGDSGLQLPAELCRELAELGLL